MKLKVGQKAPDFILKDQYGKTHRLSEYKGKWLVLYFYPKDMTPGCTIEAQGFANIKNKYSYRKAVIVGISVDTIESHARFCDVYQIPFTLLSDHDKVTVRDYGVWTKKKFYGITRMATNRITFLIDPKGKIVKIYDKIKPKIHAEEVLADLIELQKK